MLHPRIMHIVSTKYFDFLFSAQSADTVRILTECCDDFYEEAQKDLKINKVKRLPVTISPDSDEYSVKFSSSPYACISIYEGVPQFSEGDYESALLEDFRHEVYISVSQKAKSLAITKNLPFTFVEGFAYVEELQCNSPGFEDKKNYYEMLLAQAKLDGKFPSWFQASASRDVSPYNQVSLAAAAAFSGYLIQLYGFERYLDFWAEAGKLNPFKMTSGIFKKIYGIKITEAWHNFVDSIPVPDLLESGGDRPLEFGTSGAIEAVEIVGDRPLVNRNTDLVDLGDRPLITNLFSSVNEDSYYKYALNTAYGIVWYDDFRHEVDFCHEISNFKLREILFWAEDVTNLTVSPDGRFLVLSHTRCSTRTNFKKDEIKIYDLKMRYFLSETYDLRDGQIVILPDGKLGIAGIYVKDKISELRIYKSVKLNKISFGDRPQKSNHKPQLIYSKKYPKNFNIQTPVQAENGEIFYLLHSRGVNEGTDPSYTKSSVVNDNGNRGDRPLLVKLDLSSFQESYWDFQNPTVCNLRLFSIEKHQLCFTYSEAGTFNRLGLLTLDSSSQNIITVLKQIGDFSGGVNYAFLKDDQVFYCSQKFDHSELRSVPLNNFSFEYSPIYSTSLDDGTDSYFRGLSPSDSSGVTRGLSPQNSAADSETAGGLSPIESINLPQSLYNPLKYQYKGDVQLFMPVLDFELQEGIKYWPGLGFSYKTKTDILGNNVFVLSASSVYLPMEFAAVMQNLTREERLEYLNTLTELENNYSFAGAFYNSSLPVDIFGGTIFKFNNDGQWSWQSQIDVSYDFYFRLPTHVLSINLETSFLAGTEFYDSIQISTHPDLDSWTSLKDSYKTTQVSARLEYSNVHQYGFSEFENSGFSIAATIYTLWDNTLFQNNQNVTGLVDANWFDKISQVNGTFSTSIYIPQLNNINNHDGWILSCPTLLHLDLLDTSGKALETYGEILLFGKEIQNGFAPLYTYFNRIGLKLGYDFSLIYDTDTVSLPDLRDIHHMMDIFQNTYISQNIYAKLNLDIVPVIGQFSKHQVKTELKFAYYPLTQGILLNFGAQLKL